MTLRPLSIRVRLTMWHLAVVRLIISAFSVGIYLFTKASLLGQLQEQLDTKLAAVEKMLKDEPDELAELQEDARTD